jgi:exosortase K
MKQKLTDNLTWERGAQWAVVLLCAITLKLYYSNANADQLRWILAPTTICVELLSGTSFEFESGAGYFSYDRSFLIAPVCAGVNFFITAFLLLAARKLLRSHPQDNVWSYIPAVALIAYLVTLVANTVRIAIALQLKYLPEIGLLSHSQLHRVEGILVYSGFLLLLFAVSEKMEAGKASSLLQIETGRSLSLLRKSALPLLVYYAITLGIPLVNGGYRQGASFWEHSAFVLVIPWLLILPFAVVVWLRKRFIYRGRSLLNFNR